MAEGSRLIQPLPGFSPEIGRLVAMLTYVRRTTLKAVEGLTQRDLDHLHDERSNSIGALLAHISAVETYYQALSFEQRPFTAQEQGRWGAALELGARGRQELRGRPLSHYVSELEQVRARTLTELARRPDAWLEERLARGHEPVNHHWIWFHVFEDELNHRGQIRWLRTRLTVPTDRDQPRTPP